jgi:Replication-relaxation
VLGPVGAVLLGAEDRDERRWAPQVRADRQLGLERSPRLAHMTGRDWFLAALVRHAREHGGELAGWLNGPGAAARCQQAVVRSDDRARLPRPDGAGTWAEDGQAVAFLLEYDTGTEHLAVLAGKLDGYGVLAGLAWHGQLCPVPLPCFPSPRPKQAARRAVAATSQAARLRIAAARPATSWPTGLAPTCSRRVRCFDLVAQSRSSSIPRMAAWPGAGKRETRRPDARLDHPERSPLAFRAVAGVAGSARSWPKVSGTRGLRS